jgi:hypothetical protein
MLKITSFSALIVGLLLAAPMVFSDAEASHSVFTGVAAKSDRESTDKILDNRLASAFHLVDLCSPGASGDAAEWCAARRTEQADALTTSAIGKTSFNGSTVESRDEATQTSTISVIPIDFQ